MVRRRILSEGRKVAVIAVSLGNIQLPAHIVYNNNDWGFIFVGDSFPRGLSHCETRHCNFIEASAIEYEDVIQLADFWVSGGGAGSVSVALYTGVPQYIFPIGQGSDKRSKKRNIIKLRVSPPDMGNDWGRLFDVITKAYSHLLKNAQNVKGELVMYEDGIERAMQLISSWSELPPTEESIFRKRGNALTCAPRIRKLTAIPRFSL